MHIVRTAAGCISVPKIGKIFSDAEAPTLAARPTMLDGSPGATLRPQVFLDTVVFSDLEWMHGLVGKHFDMPPITSPTDLVGWIKSDPRKWAAAVRLCRRVAICIARNSASVDSFLRPIHNMMDAVGLPDHHSFERPKLIKTKDVSDFVFNCPQCDQTFDSFQLRQTHLAVKHEVYTEGSNWLTSNGLCCGCLRLFHTPNRLGRHLNYTHDGKQKCVPTIAAHYSEFHQQVSTTDCSKKPGVKHEGSLHEFDDAAWSRAPVVRLSGPIFDPITIPLPPDIDPCRRVQEQSAPTQIDPKRVLAQLTMQIHLTCIVIIHVYSGRKRPGCLSDLAPLVSGLAGFRYVSSLLT